VNAIIIGATSGIGRELAKQMSALGYSLGLTGRREHLLDSLAEELATPCFKAVMDVADLTSTVEQFDELVERMETVDIVIISAGFGSVDLSAPLSDELDTVAVNVAGFTAIANRAYQYFSQTGQGQIVAISSVAAIKGGVLPSYNASKAYVKNYLEGLACRAYAQNKAITITEIRPGFVDTAMAKGEGIFWMTPLPKAAKQILSAIKRKKRVAYISKRWLLIGLLLNVLPFSWYLKLTVRRSAQA